VVEHREGDSWTQYAMVAAEVKKGLATGTLRVNHPQVPPGVARRANAPPLDLAHLRFKVELGLPEEVPQTGPGARGKDGQQAGKTAPAARGKDGKTAPGASGFKAEGLTWKTKKLGRGAEAHLYAKVSGQGNRKVRFVVEQLTSGKWKNYATVPATVKGSEATGKLTLGHAGGKETEPLKLRFLVELA
jgi:hypothetical protein